MRVSIHTLGTRGDVQPYLALAMGLRARGHSVLLAAPSQFQELVEGQGVAFAHLPREFLDLMETPEAKATIAGSAGFGAGFKMLKLFKPIARRQLSAEWQAAQEFAPDLFIYHPKAIAVPHIAERLSRPAVLASPLPGFTPTREFASPMVPFRLFGPLNRLTHSLMANGGDALFRGMIADWRVRELGIGPKPTGRLAPAATLYGYSRQVLPRPADWPGSVAVCGYWVLPDHRPFTPDRALQDFLSGGDAPVYVGFGSMPGIDPDALTNLVVSALARAGRRGVLATGGGALRAVEVEHVHALDYAPHDKLFPLMSAAVHHGGAGTTGASLMAGKPTVICPFFGDQPFWGRLVAGVNAGPRPVDARKLTVEGLAAAIREATTDPVMRSNASSIGALLRAENGVEHAIGHLERMGLLGG